MTCREICKRYKVAPRYKPGVVRCSHCEMFMKFAVGWCPCCGYKTRTRPRKGRKL